MRSADIPARPVTEDQKSGFEYYFFIRVYDHHPLTETFSPLTMHSLISFHFCANFSQWTLLIHVSLQFDDYCCTILPPQQCVICNRMDMQYAFFSPMSTN